MNQNPYTRKNFYKDLISALIVAGLIAACVSAKAQTISKDTAKFPPLMLIDSVPSATSLTYSLNSFPKLYIVDWSKIKTFNDFKNVMQALNIYVSADFKNFKKLKKYLIESK